MKNVYYLPNELITLENKIFTSAFCKFIFSKSQGKRKGALEASMRFPSGPGWADILIPPRPLMPITGGSLWLVWPSRDRAAHCQGTQCRTAQSRSKIIPISKSQDKRAVVLCWHFFSWIREWGFICKQVEGGTLQGLHDWLPANLIHFSQLASK